MLPVMIMSVSYVILRQALQFRHPDGTWMWRQRGRGAGAGAGGSRPSANRGGADWEQHGAPNRAELRSTGL